MLCLFLVGVEGSGHSMMRSVMVHVINQDGFVDQGQWHNILVAHWSRDGHSTSVSRVRGAARTARLRERLCEVFKEERQQGSRWLLESASFPFGQPRDVHRRPDLLEFHEMVDGLVEVRYLVLYRHPVSAAYSGIRRGFTSDVYLQAGIVRDNLDYIATQLSRLPATSYRVLHFDDCLNAPSKYLPKVAAWWRLDYTQVAQGIGNLRQPFAMSDIPEETRGVLQGVITKAQMTKWSAAFANNRM